MGTSKSVISKHEFGLKRRHKKRRFLRDNDEISKLPDEILVSILSLLTILEAVRTSTLSHRWERLWINYHGDLDFDIPKRLFNVKVKFCTEERSKYISYWIKQVLEPLLLFGSSSLTAFTVRLDGRGTYRRRALNKFLQFVMARRIQKLELDFASNNTNYSFPSEFYDWIKQPCGVNGFSALTSFTLKNIDVSGETIELLLSNCPLLERLCVIHSWTLSQLKVSGASVLSLKHLMIICHSMNILEVSAPNLLYLHVFGNRKLKLHAENVPKLVDVSVTYATYVSSSLSEYLSQFQTLLFEFHVLEKVSYKFSEFVASNKLKHLVFRARIFGQAGSLLRWTSLVEACPFLQKFTLDAMTFEHNYRDTVREIKRVSGEYRHPCLKVVELAGFTGIATEVELAIYFLENSSKLEQIIIDRRRTIHKGTPSEFDKDKPLEVQQKRALQLKRYLPPGVELLII